MCRSRLTAISCRWQAEPGAGERDHSVAHVPRLFRSDAGTPAGSRARRSAATARPQCSRRTVVDTPAILSSSADADGMLCCLQALRETILTQCYSSAATRQRDRERATVREGDASRRPCISAIVSLLSADSDWLTNVRRRRALLPQAIAQGREAQIEDLARTHGEKGAAATSLDPGRALSPLSDPGSLTVCPAPSRSGCGDASQAPQDRGGPRASAPRSPGRSGTGAARSDGVGALRQTTK